MELFQNKPDDQKPYETRPRFLVKIRNYFTTGLLVLAPTMVTLWVLYHSFRIIDGILGSLFTRYVFEPLVLPTPPGLGALTLFLFITLIGMVTRLYTGRKLFEVWETVINRVPLFNRIYVAVRQIADAVAKGGGIIFQYPVLVEYPRRGMFAIGFLTRHCDGPFCKILGREVSTVFIPTTPNPTSGFLIFIPNEDITPLNMSVEDAMKLIISGGTVSPDIRLPVVRESP